MKIKVLILTLLLLSASQSVANAVGPSMSYISGWNYIAMSSHKEGWASLNGSLLLGQKGTSSQYAISLQVPCYLFSNLQIPVATQTVRKQWVNGCTAAFTKFMTELQKLGQTKAVNDKTVLIIPRL